MAIYMPPIARKKRVSTRYNPDTFRVISVEAEDSHPILWPPVLGQRELPANPVVTDPNWNAIRGKPQVLPHPVGDYRANRPHPSGCGFLRHNVGLLNEPICTVYTDATNVEQDSWWPSRTSSEPLKTPLHTRDTIYRQDFHLDKEKRSVFSGLSRHASNPNKDPAFGVVPVNFLRSPDGKQRLLKEKISFEHLYNCRMVRNYPIRAKRHGSFVWQHISPEKARQMIEHHTKLDEETKLSADMLDMVSQEGCRKGSQNDLSVVRSSTFVDHIKSEKLPQSTAGSLTSANVIPHDKSSKGSQIVLSPARSPTFVNRISAEKLPQSPIRSLTSVELKQNSRQTSGIHSPLGLSIDHYPVIPSVQDACEVLHCGEPETIEPKVASRSIGVSALSRKRATPMQTPISAQVNPATPTSANAESMRVRINNNKTQVGIPCSANKSKGPATADCTFNFGNPSTLAAEKNLGFTSVKAGEGKPPVSPFVRTVPITTSVKPANSVPGYANPGHNATEQANGIIEAQSCPRDDKQITPTTVDTATLQYHPVLMSNNPK